MSKKKRLAYILSIINQQDVSTQDELTELLTNQGFDVSQSTVSRDIKELNLIKLDERGKYKYVQPNSLNNNLSPQLISLFKQIIVSIECANNLIVIRTLSGNASAAGMAIDEMRFPQVLGTVAGDDTVLVIAKTNADAEIVLKSLRTL